MPVRTSRLRLLAALVAALLVAPPGLTAASAAPSASAHAPVVAGGVAAKAGPVTGKRKKARQSRARKVATALRVANRQRGDWYQYGAAGPHRFDCSGLVYYATHRAGFPNVPRSSSAQARFMKPVKRAKMRRGDFVFFTGRSGVYHVGIFVGRRGGRVHVLHSPRSGERVKVDRVWTDSWFPRTLR